MLSKYKRMIVRMVDVEDANNRDATNVNNLLLYVDFHATHVIHATHAATKCNVGGCYQQIVT